jgi:hypothetical protein
LPENIDPHTTSILPGRCSSPDMMSVMMSAKIQRLYDLHNFPCLFLVKSPSYVVASAIGTSYRWQKGKICFSPFVLNE